MKAPRDTSSVINYRGNDARCNPELITEARQRRTFLKAAVRMTAASIPLCSSAPLLSDVIDPSLDSTATASAKEESASTQEPDRVLRLWNVHTGEHYEGPYWSHGHFMTAALDQISYLLRDHRMGEARPIDPFVIDFVHAISAKLPASDPKEPIQILSGYRSPETNANLAKRSNGVAKNSLHMKGRAIDFRMPEHKAKTLRQVAINTRRGGVGFYPEKDFIHIDTGPIRSWE